MRQEHISRFLGIPGHSVAGIYFLDANGRAARTDRVVERVVIALGRVGKGFRCSCGRQFERYYDCREQSVRDLPWGPWSHVELLVPRFRVACPDCGVKTEPLAWIEVKDRHTRRLAEAVALACREVRSVKAIAEAFHLGWDLVKEIDQAALQRRLNPPDFAGLRHLALDEFAVRRGHTYGTIFLDLGRHRVLWVCATREKQAVKGVFDKVFGAEVCARIAAVSMDWWGGYEAAVAECLPQAKIVWDLFHVVKKYNHEVLNRVRLDESLRYQDRRERLAFKKTKFLLVKNRRHLRPNELARLRELLRVNHRLFVAYLLRDGLKRLWAYRYPEWARRWFHSWYRRAIGSRIGPLKRFARALKERLDGILAHCRHPINSGVLEGIINKVKVIKRIAYGYRDNAYFFLKIRAHFTGVTPL